MPTGDVQITLTDGSASAVQVPASSVQLVLGTCSVGSVSTPNQIVATRNKQSALTSLGYGLLTEYAGLAINAGGTVVAIPVTINAAGVATAVVFTGTGTSVITVTLDGTVGSFDDLLVYFSVQKGATIGVSGATFLLSLDGGKNFGPPIALGTANTYAIPNTGITLNFAAGTLVAGDKAKFSTKAPAWATGGIQNALNAFQASQYAAVGVGSVHIVGPMSGANAGTVGGYMDTLASGYIFNRAMTSVRDVAIPSAWGGPGAETEAQWTTSILSDFSAASAKRVAAAAGHYNMASAYPTSVASAPAYRRSLSWALAARTVAVPPQRHAGRVRDGALTQITVDPTSDPNDGFVYHDERVNPGLDFKTGGAGRFTSARTRVGKPGFFIVNPLTLAPIGSDYWMLPYGQVIDIACGIAHQIGQDQINEDLRLQQNGTLFPNDASTLGQDILNALNDQMTAKSMISSATVVVDTTNNVRTTGVVKITITIYARGYVLEEDIFIGLGNQQAAA